mgnify:CR=1 FL=1
MAQTSSCLRRLESVDAILACTASIALLSIACERINAKDTLQKPSAKSSALLTSASCIAALRCISPTILARSYTIASNCIRFAVTFGCSTTGSSSVIGAPRAGLHAGDLP